MVIFGTPVEIIVLAILHGGAVNKDMKSGTRSRLFWNIW